MSLFFSVAVVTVGRFDQAMHLATRRRGHYELKLGSFRSKLVDPHVLANFSKRRRNIIELESHRSR